MQACYPEPSSGFTQVKPTTIPGKIVQFPLVRLIIVLVFIMPAGFIHRVIKDFMVQGGGFTTDYEKKDTQKGINNEATNGLRNEKYTVAMARTNDPHSATAQFFINTKNNSFLNHTSQSSRGWGYAVFGIVTKGRDIVDKMNTVATGSAGPFSSDAPAEQIVIKSVQVLK